MTPERCAITMATVTASLPDWANSGQYVATGWWRSISPRSTSRCTQVLVNPLDPENTLTKVSWRHGRRPSASCQPPHRSTTSSPSTHAATAAPTSPRSAKLRSNCSRTPSNAGAHDPPTGTSSAVTATQPWELRNTQVHFTGPRRVMRYLTSFDSPAESYRDPNGTRRCTIRLQTSARWRVYHHGDA